MAITVKDRVQKYRKKKGDEGYRQITILLDKESAERFERLKSKINRFHKWSSSDLVGRALLSYEKEIDDIFKREVLKFSKNLQEGGLSYREIAERLNEEGIPTASGRGKWHEGTVRNFLEKMKTA